MKKLLCILTFFSLLLMSNVFSDTYRAESEDDRKRCIEQYGWKISEEAGEVAEIKIPEPLNLVYIRYNEMQKRAGFDISPYAGRKVLRYTYRVLNHRREGGVYADIFVCDGKMIAGDIMSRNIGGFMHEINRKEFIK